MLHTDNIEIGGIPFIHNYSDSGFMIEREDGKRFSDAKDLATENHTYVETDEPILEPETDIPIDIEPLFNKNKLIITDTYENSNVQPYPNWNGNNIEYKAGDKVIYDNEIYEILQSHTSQPDWKPNNTIGLFRKII